MLLLFKFQIDFFFIYSNKQKKAFIVFKDLLNRIAIQSLPFALIKFYFNIFGATLIINSNF